MNHLFLILIMILAVAHIGLIANDRSLYYTIEETGEKECKICIKGSLEYKCQCEKVVESEIRDVSLIIPFITLLLVVIGQFLEV